MLASEPPPNQISHPRHDILSLNVVAVWRYTVLYGRIAPEYIGPVVRVTDLPGRQALRSARTLQTFNNRQSSLPSDQSASLEKSAQRYYIVTVDVDFSSLTGNSYFLTIIPTSRPLNYSESFSI